MNVSEFDHEVVVWAVLDAKEAGKRDMAERLDKLARKMNAALTNRKAVKLAKYSGVPLRVSWKDMPSLLEQKT